MPLHDRLKSRKKGFTLIELLVVIAIIALLLSILMPALAKVKMQARRLICSTNVRTLFTAWSLYATDSDNMIVNPYTYRGGPFNPTEADTDPECWSWAPWNAITDSMAAGTLTLPLVEARKEGVRRGSLFTYADNAKVFTCRNKLEGELSYRSYSIPDFLNGEWGIPGRNGTANDTYVTYKKVGAILRTSTTFVFIEENDPRNVLWDSFVMINGSVRTQTTTSWGDPITTRHSGSSSFVFADGHVEFKRWSKDTVNIMAPPPVWGAAAEDKNGNPSAEAEADIQWIFDHWSR